jgi:hypothetical protein
MSGSSGGGGGGGHTSADTSCEDLVIDTQLNSPKEEVVVKLKLGELLDVSLETRAGTDVILVKHKGKVAGSVTSPLSGRLRKCLQKGIEYTAEVKKLVGGQVHVRIAAKDE